LEVRNLLSTFTVDRLTDTGAGSGLNGDLRYCITNAVDGDTITFGVHGEIPLNGPLPILTHCVSIEGPGADSLTIRRGHGGYYRDFFVGGGANVHLSNLIIYEGYDIDGGGIRNLGTLTISNCTIAGTRAIEGDGGAINNAGTLTISNSTITTNFAPVGSGGGIFNSGSLTVINSTIAGNSAGSIYVGGGIDNFGGTVTINNTIIAGNTAAEDPDLYGNLTSLGYNLIGNTQGASGFDPSDLLDIDPKLSSLYGNGGPTLTMALLPGSPALNAGDPGQLGVPDQRGLVRSGGVNIGAYQASASAFTLAGLPASTTAGTALNVTVTAIDPFGQTAIGYTGTIHFTSTDNGATLPADYPFTAGANGSHTFPAGIILVTAGSQTVAATDTADGSITGSAAVAVNPAAADHLIFFQPPTDTAAGQTIVPAVMVAVVDQFGNVVTGDNSDTVTLSIGVNPAGGTLSGTLTVAVVNGVATFGDLSIDQPGAGYTLHATVGGSLPDIDSNSFSIT
jgi:hypothetical protein